MSKDNAGNLATSDISTFTTLGTPAAFTVSDLSISPTEVDIGGTVTISATVTNTGDGSGSYDVTLKIDSTVITTERVTLAGGENEELTFTVSEDASGTHSVDVNGLKGTFSVKAAPVVPPVVPPTPAKFTVSDVTISPAEVDTDQTVTISVDVANIGEQSGSYTVTLKVDGVIIATKDVTLVGGASQKVTFTTSKDVAGTYSVDVNGKSGTFTVKAPLAVPPPPPTKPVNWWLWGSIIAVGVIIIIVVVMLVIRNRY